MKHKNKLLNSTALSQPDLLLFANKKGGIGKTLLATMCVDLLTLYEHAFQVAQVDDQDRLERTLRVRLRRSGRKP